MKNTYIQYGCGNSNPIQWVNYDSSPTLIIQQFFFFCFLLKPFLNSAFPKNIKYGDIVKGLKISENSCDGIYCSHVLEHLSYNDLLKSLYNTHKYLKPGGIFRMVLPDMEFLCKQYIYELEKKDSQGCVKLMEISGLGIKDRNRGIKDVLINMLGNSNHQWMWDYCSLSHLLKEVGFSKVRKSKFNDSEDEMFIYVEEKNRFNKDCFSIEAIK